LEGEPDYKGNRLKGRASRHGKQINGASQRKRETDISGEPEVKGNRLYGRARTAGKQISRASQATGETDCKGEPGVTGNRLKEVIIIVNPNEEKEEEVGPLDIIANRLQGSGFQSCCPLPDELKNEVLGQTTTRKRRT